MEKVQLQKEILDRKLELKPIWYKEKWDGQRKSKENFFQADLTVNTMLTYISFVYIYFYFIYICKQKPNA